MRFFIFFAHLLAVCFLVGCQGMAQVISPASQNISLHTTGRIIDTRTQRQISVTELLNALGQYQYILLGEEHDNALHHQIETALIKQLEQQRPLSAVVIEMMDVGQQALISQTQKELHTCCQYSPSQIRQKLHWAKWDWSQYQDFIVSRMNSNTPLLGANLTEPEIQTLMQGAQPLQGNLSIRPSVQQKIAQLVQSHHTIDANLLAKRVQIQQFRDRRMAETLQKQTALSVLVAGNHHVQKDIGVPLHLADYAQQQQKPLPNVTIMLKSAVENTNVSQADYVWITN